jgi:hydroxymethylpyrimidine/phosphomethylpyrimidine kinase
VVDPVMVAKGGDRLLTEDAVHAMRTVLFRLARVVTPNVPEAEALANLPVRSVRDMHAAGRRILTFGPAAVLVKGGHLAGETVTDVLVDASGVIEMSAPHVAGRHTHGTGCTLAAAIAARLANGESLERAARAAKEYVAGAMLHGIDLGGGHRPLGHFWRSTHADH